MTTGTINGALSTSGYLLALLREFLHVPRFLTDISKAKQVRTITQTNILYQITGKGPKIDPHVSNSGLVDFVFEGFRSTLEAKQEKGTGTL